MLLGYAFDGFAEVEFEIFDFFGIKFDFAFVDHEGYFELLMVKTAGMTAYEIFAEIRLARFIIFGIFAGVIS